MSGVGVFLLLEKRQVKVLSTNTAGPIGSVSMETRRAKWNMSEREKFFSPIYIPLIYKSSREHFWLGTFCRGNVVRREARSLSSTPHAPSFGVGFHKTFLYCLSSFQCFLRCLIFFSARWACLAINLSASEWNIVVKPASTKKAEISLSTSAWYPVAWEGGGIRN